MNSEEIDIVTDTYQSSVKKIAKDLFYLNRKHEYSPPFQVVDAFGNFNIYAHAHVKKGDLCIKANSQDYSPAGVISIYIPKLSLIEWRIFSPYLEWHAYVSDQDFAPQIKDTTIFNGALASVNTVDDISNWLAHSWRSSVNLLHAFPKPVPLPLAFEIKNYIDSHFLSEMGISEIADNFGLSDSQLTKIFKSEFNISPVKYRSKIRVFQSMYDLFHKEGSVIDIAMDTGFNDLSRFNKQFKNITKTTPSKFKFHNDR